MPFYLVQLAASAAAAPRIQGANAYVVFAGSVADARAACKSAYSFDTSAIWDAATVTELVAAANLDGLTIEVVINFAGSNFVGREVTKFTVVGDADDTPLALATKLRDALNDDASLAGCTVANNVVTIIAANNAGDLVITATAKLNGVAVPGLAPVVSAAGVAASARTITLPTGSLAAARLRVTVADSTNPVDVTVTADSIDALGAAAVAALNATALLSNVAYDANTQVLTIPGASDAQGAKVITAELKLDGVATLGLQPTVNAAGASGIDRTITLPADAALVPPPVPRVIKALTIEA